MRRELELARCEIEMLRRSNHAVVRESRTQETHDDVAAAMSRLLANMNLKMIAELVNDFDGTPDMFDLWERQVKFIKMTYQLTTLRSR